MINSEEIEYVQALAEISYILKYTDKELVQKIPNKFLKYIEENKDKKYIVNIDENIPLEEQKLKEKTKNLMALIYRNYFCNEEEKKEYDELLNENQIKYDEELNEKYSYENIFKQNKKEIIEETTEEIIENTQQTALIDYENMKWYKKVIFKITDWFKVLFNKKDK